MKVYSTERLILKILDKSYAKLVTDYYLRNKDFLSEWISLRNNDFYTIKFQEKQLEKDLINIESNNFLRLWIFEKCNNERAIGTIAFNNILWNASLSCNLGYRLDKDEINKGYITEAVKKGIEIIFSDYKLHRIEANIMAKNKPSLKVVEKLGFKNEGISYQYLKINGKWEDHVRMVLINDEM